MRVRRRVASFHNFADSHSRRFNRVYTHTAYGIDPRTVIAAFHSNVITRKSEHISSAHGAFEQYIVLFT